MNLKLTWIVFHSSPFYICRGLLGKCELNQRGNAFKLLLLHINKHCESPGISCSLALRKRIKSVWLWLSDEPCRVTSSQRSCVRRTPWGPPWSSTRTAWTGCRRWKQESPWVKRTCPWRWTNQTSPQSTPQTNSQVYGSPECVFILSSPVLRSVTVEEEFPWGRLTVCLITCTQLLRHQAWSRGPSLWYTHTHPHRIIQSVAAFPLPQELRNCESQMSLKGFLRSHVNMILTLTSVARSLAHAGWLWLRFAHFPALRPLLPGGPEALLHGGCRHGRRHLPEGKLSWCGPCGVFFIIFLIPLSRSFKIKSGKFQNVS